MPAALLPAFKERCAGRRWPGVVVRLLITVNVRVSLETTENSYVEACSTVVFHAATPWHETAEARLRFSCVLAVAMQFGEMVMQHAGSWQPNDLMTNSVCGRFTKPASSEIDTSYPASKPASRETASARRQEYASHVIDVEGDPKLVVTDAKISHKFRSVAVSVLKRQDPGHFAGKFLEHRSHGRCESSS
jgi:2-methylcitrate dehydratase PrpD